MVKKNALFIVSYNRYLSFFTEEGRSGFWSDLLICYDSLFDLTIIIPHENYKEFKKINNLYGIENMKAYGVPWIRKSKKFPSTGLANVIEKLFKNNNFDYIICQNSMPFGLTAKFLAHKFKAKLIIHEHTAFRTVEGNNVKKGIGNWFHFLRALALLMADKIITPSEFLKTDIQRTLKLKKSIKIVPNPLFRDMKNERFEVSSRDQNSGIAVANWHINKNLKLLIEAIGIVNRKMNFRLDIVGYLTKEVENSIKDLDLKNVHFHGHQNHLDVLQLMKKADVFILPSQYETFSLPVIESLILKTPVISTKCGAPEYLLQNNRGILCDHNPESLAKCIENFLLGDSLIDTVLASKWAKNYVSKDNVVNQLKNALIC